MGKEETAIFAAGCFWHVQMEFSEIGGVLKTTAGYTGGELKNPTYEQVSSEKTGHVEAVEIVYDPEKVSYEKLLDVFWMIHDPTTLNRQGWDIGNSYRSVIFYTSDEQKKLAEESRDKYQKMLDRPIVTEIVKAREFYPAEEYHQHYVKKHKLKACSIK